MKVAVVGGGISGLILTKVLQDHGQEATVFERDASPTARTQGGILDLAPDKGQWALKQAGLFQKWQELIIEGASDMRVVDRTAKVWWEDESTGRPEVDRPALRKMLLDSLQPGTVQWGHHLVSVQSNAVESHKLCFADGSTISADVVVGADGAQSRVRQLVTDAKPKYCGISWFDILINDAARNCPDVAATVGRGSYLALDDNKAILAQRSGNGNILAYATVRIPEDSLSEQAQAWESPAASREAVAALFKGWAPGIVELIHSCEQNMKMKPRPVFAMPVGITWPSKPNATLLGDAAHVMSPFAGEGANLALVDGASLALELVKKQSPAEAIAAYDAEMFQRSEPAAAESAFNLDLCISEKGAEEMARLMHSYSQMEG